MGRVTYNKETQGFLSQKTLDYWNVSCIRNGHINVRLTTSGAIIVLRDLKYSLGPHRKLLLGCIEELEKDIIFSDTIVPIKLEAEILPLTKTGKNHVK